MSDGGTREQIVEAADRLFYERGYRSTSFADIAEEVRISRGNFYHHFKSKDEILASVIEARLAATRAMLECWEAESADPADRIRSYVEIVLRNREKIERHGCPVGTLVSELVKLDHDAHEAASAVFGLFRAWLREQFEALGRGADADALAMHVLAWSQGVATMASAFPDEAFLRREVEQLCERLGLGEHAGRGGRRRASRSRR